MKRCLINIIGTPRIYMKENADSILENIISNNKNCLFDVVIHTSTQFIETCTRIEVNKKRTLIYKDNTDLKNKLLENYNILSNNINIIIESIDFDIGLINYNFKSFNNYLRIKRIFDLTNNINDYDIIVNCRNDIIFNNKINIDKIENNFYTILGKKGGFKGYAHGDFDACLIFNKNNYYEFNKCINHLFTYNDDNKIFYKTDKLKFIKPLFENSFPFLDDNYYNHLGNQFNKELVNKTTTRTICGLGEILINYLTHFLKPINSKWDVHHFKEINSEILWPKM